MVRAKLVHDYAGHYQRMEVFSFDVHPSEPAVGAVVDEGRSVAPAARPAPREKDRVPEAVPGGLLAEPSSEELAEASPRRS
jgi:hypothetical protein